MEKQACLAITFKADIEGFACASFLHGDTPDIYPPKMQCGIVLPPPTQINQALPLSPNNLHLSLVFQLAGHHYGHSGGECGATVACVHLCHQTGHGDS